MTATAKPNSLGTHRSMKDIKECFSIMAEHMNATHIEYTHEVSILRIQLSEDRSQNVRGYIKKRGEHDILILMSKVCSLEEYPNIDYKRLIFWNDNLRFSKFVVQEEYLEVTAHARLENVPMDYLQMIIKEVAWTADQCELDITGKDVQ